MFSLCNKTHALLCGFFVFLALIMLDQLIKYFVFHAQTIEFLCNYGVIFGITLPFVFFIVVWIVDAAVILGFWFYKRNESFFVQLPFVLIAAGGASNMIDRIFYGCVVDYIPLLMISSFNFADALISVGVFLWVVQLLQEKKKN